MKQYNFTFYHIDPMTDEVLDYAEKTVWTDNRADALKTAREWAHNNGYNDFEEEDN